MRHPVDIRAVCFRWDTPKRGATLKLLCPSRCASSSHSHQLVKGHHQFVFWPAWPVSELTTLSEVGPNSLANFRSCSVNQYCCCSPFRQFSASSMLSSSVTITCASIASFLPCSCKLPWLLSRQIRAHSSACLSKLHFADHLHMLSLSTLTAEIQSLSQIFAVRSNPCALLHQ